MNFAKISSIEEFPFCSCPFSPFSRQLPQTSCCFVRKMVVFWRILFVALFFISKLWRLFVLEYKTLRMIISENPVSSKRKSLIAPCLQQINVSRGVFPINFVIHDAISCFQIFVKKFSLHTKNSIDQRILFYPKPSISNLLIYCSWIIIS